MKKKISITIACLVLIVIIIYIGTIYHGMPKEVCGSGLSALRLVGVIIGVLLLGSILFDLRQSSMFKTLCASCSAEMEKEWLICPYCGLERRRDDLK
ncbi:hypothetical protein [Anaerosolibacter sp.]|uniref:hypothetical protein n=1 Tax=Anaerosolibacter sp. TaxID=1872527 RepID=UPI0039F0786A